MRRWMCFGEELLREGSRWRAMWELEGWSEIVMRPHTGFVSEGTMWNWWVQAIENLERSLKGKRYCIGYVELAFNFYGKRAGSRQELKVW